MRSVSAVLVCVLLSYSGCVSPANTTEGECEVKEGVAVCGEDYKWPEDDRITKIVVRSSQLTGIEKTDLAKYEYLETLDVSYSGLLHINSEAFSSNEKLTELNLSGNKDFKIPTEAFISSKSLTHLNLSHIAIEELPENVFNDLPNLQVIDLTSTNIKNFSSLSNLEHLQTLLISEVSDLNKSSLCQETHLHQIIEIENDKQTPFSCHGNKDTTESEPTTTNLPVSSENIEKEEEIKHSETTLKPETETQKIEIITEVKETNTSAPEEDHPKNLEEKPETPETPESNNSTDGPETSKGDEETKDVPEQTEEKQNLETETEIGVTQNPTENEDKAITTTDNTDSLIRFNNVPPPPKENQTHADIKEENEQDNDANVKAAISPPNPAESSGVNIVLGIILCVVVVGAVGFGYKYWKNRRGGYSNANTEDVEEGKELQNMVSHRVPNGESEQN